MNRAGFVLAATHMLAGVVGAMETEQQRLAMRLFIHSQIEKDVIDAAGFMTAQAAIKKAMGVRG